MFSCACFIIRTLNILTIVVLNSQYDHSNIPAKSGSDDCCLLKLCFLSFGVLCNFLIAKYNVLSKRKRCK